MKAGKIAGLWYKAEVVHGNKIGGALGYPTLNLSDPKILSGSETGVYAAFVKIDDKIYQGVLYFGPRKVLSETNNIIEIFLLDFVSQIYGEKISFYLIQFIRKVMDFSNFDSLKKQIEKDVNQAKAVFNRSALISDLPLIK